MIHRLGDRRTFQAFRRGHRARRGPLSVTWLPAEAPGPPRVAYAIGRKVGGAVERNRLRRRLRAIVATEAPNLATGSYLVGATAEASSLGVEELQTIVKQAMQAAVTR